MWRKAKAEKGREYHKQSPGTVDSAEDLLPAGKTAIGLSRTLLPEQSGRSQTFPF
jgi:hypothetical protein